MSNWHGNISRWIVILHEFDLDFVSLKYKKSFGLCQNNFGTSVVESSDIMPEEQPIKGDIFIIASSDPLYGDILVYLHTLKCPTSTSHDERQQI
jgi:hypothetical protein